MTLNRALVIRGFLLVISILALSFFRPLLFLLLPIVVIVFYFLFDAKITKSILLLIFIILLNAIIASLYVQELNISNNFLSLFFILPVILIYFSRIKIDDQNYLTSFIKIMTWILVVNNSIALFQFIQHHYIDDAFNGFYGTHGLGLHTLSLVNFILTVYYFFSYQHDKKRMSLFLSLFFLFSAVLCFYGLGLIVFLLSIFVYKFSLRTFFKSIFIFTLMILLLGGSLYFFRYQTFLYNYENIKRAMVFYKSDPDPKALVNIPRKLLLYKYYLTGYTNDPVLFSFGSSPGTFNSRSYFLLNGEYSRTEFLEKIFGIHHPKLAEKYVHPLWNSKNTYLYMDGTRNEPFSSIIALLAEYGFISFFLLGYLAYSKYNSLIRQLRSIYNTELMRSYFTHDYLRFLTIFITLNLFTDNFLEYPEIVIIYLMIFKLIEMTINRYTNHVSIQ